MNATTVAVDLAKNVFELAVADANWRVLEHHRLTRSQFGRWFDNRPVELVVMEACGSAHHWARTLRARGIEVRLLPAQYVRAYVKRNKTDAADARALLEAARASDIKPVCVKSVEQQALQALHRTRSAWMSTRTRRINTLRGFCREFGLVVPDGAATGIAQIALPRRRVLGAALHAQRLDAAHARRDPAAQGPYRSIGMRALRNGQGKPRLPGVDQRARHRLAHQHRDGSRRR
jgi:transposase